MRQSFSHRASAAGRAAAAAVAVLAAAPAAQAVVVYSGNVNLAIPNNGIGLYLNFVDGSTYTGPNTFPSLGGGGANYDLNFYFNAVWTTFSPGTSGQSAPTVPAASKGYVSASTTTGVVALAPGTAIDNGSTYNTGSPTAAGIATGVPVLVGLRFRSENDITTAADDTVHFGWARMVLPASGAGTLINYAYESTPLTGILAGAVPEPGTWLMLGAGVLGLLGWTRRRTH